MTRVDLDDAEYNIAVEALELIVKRYEDGKPLPIDFSVAEGLRSYFSHPGVRNAGRLMLSADELETTIGAIEAFETTVPSNADKVKIQQARNILGSLLCINKAKIDKIIADDLKRSPVPNSIKDLTS